MQQFYLAGACRSATYRALADRHPATATLSLAPQKMTLRDWH